MKIKFSTDYLNMKKGDIVDCDNATANEMTSAGKAVEVAEVVIEKAIDEKTIADLVAKQLEKANKPAGDVADFGEVKSFSAKAAAIKPPTTAEFLRAVRDAEVKHVIAPCLLETKGVNEGTAGEGGYLVYSEMQNEINSVFAQSAQIAPLCRQIVAGEMANGVLVPNMAETVRSTLSGVGGSDVNAGVKWYSVDEGNSVTSSQPRFGQVEIKMHQMASLVYISDAMLQDVSNIQNIVSDQVGRSLAFYMDSEILTNPLSIATGVIGHASCTTVTTTSGSPSIQQLKNMYYSCDKPGDAVWVMSRDNAAAIEHISQSATVGAYPIFTRDVTQPQTALLFGRPIIVSDVVGATDTASSLLFGNFNKYGIVTKGNGLEPRADMSIHLAFNSLTNAYRFVVRWGGAPLVKSKVLLPSGRYIAPFVSRAN